MKYWNHNPHVALALAITLYVVLAYIYALIKPMWCDEIWSAIPSAHLAFDGFLGMGDIPTLTGWGRGSDSHIYWFPPLGLWSLAVWFKVFGMSLLSLRAHTILWGVLLFCAITRDQWKDQFSRWTGIWAIVICAVDYMFLGCSDGRPDMMCAALGIWGLTTRNAWFVSAACLVHPMGLPYIAALALIKRRIEWMPYFVGAAVWGLYIADAPMIWLDQWGSNVFLHITHTQQTKGLAVYMAYGEGWRLGLLAVYLICTVRQTFRNPTLAIWFLCVIVPALLLTRSPIYFVHVIPFFALCVANQMREWKWLTLIIIPQMVFAVTTLTVWWTWDGIFNLR